VSISFGIISSDSLTLTVIEQISCDIPEIQKLLDDAMESQNIAYALQLIGVLSRSLSDSDFDGCRPSDLRDILFEILKDLLDGDQLLLSHAEVCLIVFTLFSVWFSHQTQS